MYIAHIASVLALGYVVVLQLHINVTFVLSAKCSFDRIEGLRPDLHHNGAVPQQHSARADAELQQEGGDLATHDEGDAVSGSCMGGLWISLPFLECAAPASLPMCISFSGWISMFIVSISGFQ